MQGPGAFLPFILILVVFWLLVIRPARKRQQDMTRIQSSLAPGAEVMLGSGIYGTVMSVEDDTAQIEVAAGTTIKVARQAVVRVVEETPHALDDGDAGGQAPESPDAPGPQS